MGRNSESKMRIGFVCETDYVHHMGSTGKRREHADPKGITIYPTLGDLKRGEPCVKAECGILRVKVIVDKIIRKSRM